MYCQVYNIDCFDIINVFPAFIRPLLRNIILKSYETLVGMVLTPRKHIIALQQVTHICN